MTKFHVTFTVEKTVAIETNTIEEAARMAQNTMRELGSKNKLLSVYEDGKRPEDAPTVIEPSNGLTPGLPTPVSARSYNPKGETTIKAHTTKQPFMPWLNDDPELA